VRAGERFVVRAGLRAVEAKLRAARRQFVELAREGVALFGSPEGRAAVVRPADEVILQVVAELADAERLAGRGRLGAGRLGFGPGNGLEVESRPAARIAVVADRHADDPGVRVHEE